MTLTVREHAPLAPSSAHCWVHCAGWQSLHAAFPEPADTLPAMEGTAAHWVFEEMLAGRTVVVDMTAPNGVLITEEMLDGAELFVDTVRAALGDAKPYVEYKLSMEKTIHPDNWGTPDVFGLLENGIRLLDYKYGHLYVEEYENWQCIDYVAGIYESCGSRHRDDTPVEITIVQPRVFNRGSPVRTWKTTIGALKPYWEKMRAAAALAMCDEAPCVPDDYCRFCSGRHACEALQRVALMQIEQAYSSLPLVLPPKAASRELVAMQRAAEMLSARITGLEQYLLNQVRNGVQVPDFTVERAQGRQRWMRPAQEVIALGSLYGVNLGKPNTITPKQAIKAGVPAAVVAQLSDEPLGEWRLVQIDSTKARKAFGA